MQTMAIQIQDSYVQNFMSYVNEHSENITISKDKNLEYDPCFYERQKELHQIKKELKYKSRYATCPSVGPLY